MCKKKSAKVLVAAAIKLKAQEDMFKTGELFPALFQPLDCALDPIQAKKDEVSWFPLQLHAANFIDQNLIWKNLPDCVLLGHLNEVKKKKKTVVFGYSNQLHHDKCTLRKQKSCH